MILDLSEAGLAMQMNDRIDDDNRGRRVKLELDLSGSDALMKTTGYIAWADALGRAGVRFSDLPEEARGRLNQWLTMNAGAPSQIAPKITLTREWGWGPPGTIGGSERPPMVVSLEAGSANTLEITAETSATMQYEFKALGNDLTATLKLIGERARSLTRGAAAAIALAHKGAVICRASIGDCAPALGARLDVNSGLSGECFREARSLRCDDSEIDSRVDLGSCRKLGVRSILAAPVRYERDTIGLLMVFAPQPFNFDEGDVAVVESLAHTVVRSIRQAEALRTV